jgi:rubrerythrin
MHQNDATLPARLAEAERRIETMQYLLGKALHEKLETTERLRKAVSRLYAAEDCLHYLGRYLCPRCGTWSADVYHDHEGKQADCCPHCPNSDAP